LIKSVTSRRNRRYSSIKPCKELRCYQHAVHDIRIGIDWWRRHASSVSIVARGLIRLRHISVKHRSIAAVSDCPKTKALVGVNSTRESVARPESLINKWTFGIVRVELVGKHRKLGEATDSQRAAFTLSQQVEIHHAFFNQSHGAVQSRNS